MKCPKCINSKLNLMNHYIDSDEDESVIIRRYGYCPKCQKTYSWRRTYVLTYPSMVNPYITNDPPKECNFS